MQNAGARQLSSYLPALLLLIASIASLPHWPEARLLLPDDALWNPRLLAWLDSLMLLPLAAGLAASLLLRRPLVWPWLWLWSILSLNSRPGLGMVEQMFSLATELSILLLFSVTETFMVQGIPGFKLGLGRAWRIAAGAAVFLACWNLPIVPDNPGWQRWMLVGAGLAVLLHGINWDAVRLSRVAIPLPAIRVDISLPRLRLPGLRQEPPQTVRRRPMLSLDEGYLVRHEDMPGHGGLRRTG